MAGVALPAGAWAWSAGSGGSGRPGRIRPSPPRLPARAGLETVGDGEAVSAAFRARTAGAEERPDGVGEPGGALSAPYAVAVPHTGAAVARTSSTRTRRRVSRSHGVTSVTSGEMPGKKESSLTFDGVPGISGWAVRGGTPDHRRVGVRR